MLSISEIKQKYSATVFRALAQSYQKELPNEFGGRGNVRCWISDHDDSPSAKFYVENGEIIFYSFKASERLNCFDMVKRLGNFFSEKDTLNHINTHILTAENIAKFTQNQSTSKPQNDTPKVTEIVQVFHKEMTQSCNPKFYEKNPFAIWLFGLIGDKDLVTKTLQKFNVGTAKVGKFYNRRNEHEWREMVGTVFWQFDYVGRVRYASVIAYDAMSGKRYGNPKQPACHQNKGLTQCVYGENQLAHALSNTMVCIVESQKTAILMAILYPECIWLATCGGGSTSKFKELDLQRFDRVVLWCDADKDGRKSYTRLTNNLKAIGIKAELKDLFADKDDKSDLADFAAMLLVQRRKNTPQLTTDTQTPTDTQNEPQSEQNAIVADVLEIVEPDTNDGLLDMDIIGECDVIEMDILLKSSVFKWQVTPIPYELKGDALIDYIVEHCPIPSDLDGVTAGVTADTPKAAVKSEKDTNKRRMYETYIPTKKPNQSTIVF